jgi:hypothetical protein
MSLQALTMQSSATYIYTVHIYMFIYCRPTSGEPADFCRHSYILQCKQPYYAQFPETSPVFDSAQSLLRHPWQHFCRQWKSLTNSISRPKWLSSWWNMSGSSLEGGSVKPGRWCGRERNPWDFFQYPPYDNYTICKVKNFDVLNTKNWRTLTLARILFTFCIACVVI